MGQGAWLARRSRDQHERRDPVIPTGTTGLLKLTGFETYGLALGVLTSRILRLERTRIRFSREMPLKTEHTVAL